MSLKRKFAFHTTSSTLDYCTMGSKQSSPANQPTLTKRKRSNTQPSQDIKPIQEPTRTNPTPPPQQQPQHVQNIIPKFDTQQCTQLFQHYADPDSPNTITLDGTRQFFEDLGLSIEDVLIFAIAWKMHTSTMGYITREEWMNGMEELGPLLARTRWIN
ncbi:hypothetical protein BDF21DRAFT_153530 [Thamnidium elegans]|nr:hypothetical protein BDF21DRAFT_153530 [Thamnidium elegans]